MAVDEIKYLVAFVLLLLQQKALEAYLYSTFTTWGCQGATRSWNEPNCIHGNLRIGYITIFSSTNTEAILRQGSDCKIHSPHHICRTRINVDLRRNGTEPDPASADFQEFTDQVVSRCRGRRSCKNMTIPAWSELVTEYGNQFIHPLANGTLYESNCPANQTKHLSGVLIYFGCFVERMNSKSSTDMISTIRPTTRPTTTSSPTTSSPTTSPPTITPVPQFGETVEFEEIQIDLENQTNLLTDQTSPDNDTDTSTLTYTSDNAADASTLTYTSENDTNTSTLTCTSDNSTDTATLTYTSGNNTEVSTQTYTTNQTNLTELNPQVTQTHTTAAQLSRVPMTSSKFSVNEQQSNGSSKLQGAENLLLQIIMACVTICSFYS